MQTTSLEYKKVIKKLSLSPKAKIVVDGVEYLQNVIKEFPKISHSANSFIGSFPAKTLDFEIYDHNNNLNFENKELIVYKGFYVGNEIEWIKQGIFIPRAKDIETNISNKTIKITNATDRTQFFENEYRTNLDWTEGKTHTGLEIVQEICDKYNMSVNTDFFFAQKQMKQPNIPKGTAERKVISDIACIGGENAFVNYDGNLKIVSQFDTGDIIERSRFINLKKEKEIVINSIVLGKEGYEDAIVEPKNINEDRVSFEINNNVFADLYRNEMINDIASRIIGMSYIPYTLEGFTDGYIYELNDVISVIDRNGDISKLVILDIKNNSRIKSNLTIGTLDKDTTNYNLAGSAKQNLEEIKFDVDHNKKQIEGLISETNEIQKNITISKQFIGNPIELSDAGEYELKSIEIEGKNVVHGVTNYLKNEGKITSMNGIEYIFNEDGSIHVKGTATDTSYAFILGESLFNYSEERFKITNDYVVSGWYNTNIRLIGRGTDGKYYNIYQGNTVDIKNIPLSLIYIQVTTGATVDETIYPMITDKVSTYIPNGTWIKQIASTKNLFNKVDGISFNGHLANGILSYNGGNKVLIFPCENNKTYTISKKASSRFRIGSYPSYKKTNITVNNYVSNDTATSLTITTGNEDKFIYIEYWVNNEVSTEKEIIDSIQVETNDHSTPFEEHEENTALIDMNIYDDGNIIGHHEISEGDIFKDGILTKIDGTKVTLQYDKLMLHKGYNYITLNNDLNMNIEYLVDSLINGNFATKEELIISENNISLEVSEKYSNLSGDISNINGNIAGLEDSIAGLSISSKELQIYIQNVEKLANDINADYTTNEDLENHVPKEVTTTTGYTFGANGLVFEKTDAQTKIIINEQAVDVKDSSDNSILYAGYDKKIRGSVVKTSNLIINNDAMFQSFEDFNNNKAIGCFWMGE